MVLSAKRVAWSAVVVALVVLGLAVGATSVVEAPSEIAALSAGLAGVTSVDVAGLVVSAVTGGSEVGVASRTVLGSVWGVSKLSAEAWPWPITESKTAAERLSVVVYKCFLYEDFI